MNKCPICSALLTDGTCPQCGYNEGFSAAIDDKQGEPESVFEDFEILNGVLMKYKGNARIVKIPDGVRVINSWAFFEKTAVLRIDIPEGVETIGFDAFRGCYSLCSITLPSTLVSIGEGAFEQCRRLHSVLSYMRSDIDVTPFAHSGVVEILDRSDSQIRSVGALSDRIAVHRGESRISKTPDGFRFYSDGKNHVLLGYDYCDEHIILPDSFNGEKYSINYGAFYGCSASTITLSGGISEIGMWSFSYCDGITTVEIPKGVTSIGRYAFSGCSKLLSVTVPETVTQIEDDPFENSDRMTELVDNTPDGICEVLSDWYDVHTGESKLFTVHEFHFYPKDGVFKLIAYSGNSIALTLPESCNGEPYEIGDDAFNNSTTLKSVTVPEGVTRIGKFAFYECESLVSVTLPQSLTEIGEYAFYNSGLTEITLPAGVKVIKESAFEGCEALAAVALPNGLEILESGTFYNCSSLKEITLPESLTELDDVTFKHCKSLKSIAVPSSITKLKKHVFEGCEALAEIRLPDGLTVIGDSAFADCSALTAINLPDSLTEIEDMAFYRCTALTELTVPDGVKRIGRLAFNQTDCLKRITVGIAVTELCSQAMPTDADEIVFRSPKGWKQDGKLFPISFTNPKKAAAFFKSCKKPLHKT